MDEKLTYRSAGVDKEAGYESVRLMREHVKKTFTPHVLTDIGGFSGLVSLPQGYAEPVLVSGADGVGTKIMIAFMTDRHDTVGEDCVAMCVNDILCQGAKPLFFLDYFATGKVKPEVVAELVKGVANGCVKAGAALIGGETAEMPGLYQPGEYDLAGFAVGVVDKANIITGKHICPGDVLMGLPSSGLHSNGFSLVRKVFFEKHNYRADQYIEELGRTLGDELLTPTRIYVDTVNRIMQSVIIKGMSHITGGGFYENIPRMFPQGCGARITVEEVNLPPVFDLIARLGNIDRNEMYGTFNMGVGLVMALAASDADAAFEASEGELIYLGEVVSGNGQLDIQF